MPLARYELMLRAWRNEGNYGPDGLVPA